MNTEQLNLLLAYIEAKIQYELARREVGSDGYYMSAVNEREIVESVLVALMKSVKK